jgi:hypothetical protein
MNENGDEVINFTLAAAVADHVRDMAEAAHRPIGEVLRDLIEAGIRRDAAVRLRVREMIFRTGGRPSA